MLDQVYFLPHLLTSFPSFVPLSSATLLAMLMAATLRGCVTAIAPFLGRPASRRYWRRRGGGGGGEGSGGLDHRCMTSYLDIYDWAKWMFTGEPSSFHACELSSSLTFRSYTPISPTCGICVVFPLPVSPTTTQQELVLISFSRALRAEKMGRERRWACRSAIRVIFLLMHTLEQLPSHSSPAFTPARHYHRLAPASERCRRTKSVIQRSTTTKRTSTGTNEWGRG